MKKIILSMMLLLSTASWAELPSWGMTENQYKLPNFSNKMGEIGSQAYSNNWLLKVTAPDAWHGTIRDALTNLGERDVQLSFNDSVYQSISISAVPGAKIAKISQSTSNDKPMQKQVVIEKPEIDTAVEAPDFGDTDFKSNSNELLEGIGQLEITVPTVPVKPTVEVNKPVQAQPKRVVSATEPKPQVPSTPAATNPVTVQQPAQPVAQPNPVAQVTAPEANVEANIEAIKEDLRKRYARTKRVDKLLSYSSINSKDDLFIKGPVVLVKRFVNRGVILYYWMKEAYDPTVHKLVEKGSGKYRKDPEAIAGESPEANEVEQQVKEVIPTSLDFIAVDTAVEDQDDLRRDYIRNKRVDYSITADKLNEDDELYVLNQTVLVVRPITSSQSAYFWLVGDTTISREVERKGDNEFVIK